MSYENIKKISSYLGLYRVARWVHRHIMDREELQRFRAELAFYEQFIEAQSLCFDVGANYGSKSEVFLRLGAKVIAFEPQRDCVEELQARLGPDPHLVTINAAVGSAIGMKTLYIQRHRTKSSFAKNWPGEVLSSVEVPVTTLDDAIAKFGVPKYCKIDVEGYELEVLRGLSHAIPCVSFEYHLGQDGLEKVRACLDHLSRLGSLKINISPAEKPVFAGSHWWGDSEFIDFFSREIPNMLGYYYGDIFVKIQKSE